MNLQTRVVTLVLIALGTLTVAAHEQRTSITRVKLNERTDSLEVMHRYSIHDVEHASRTLFGKPMNVLDSKSDRQQFANYVHRSFSMADQSGGELPLQLIGHEIEGRYLWVYAEVKIPEDLSQLTLYHGALLEVWPTQSNLVNLEVGKKVKSSTFVRGSEPATIVLQPL